MSYIDARFEIKGAEAVIKRLKTLNDKMQKKGASAATRKAMNVVRDAARINARNIDDPNSPSKIWKNIKVQSATRTGRRIGGVAMRVGVSGGARRGRGSGGPGGDTWYWRLVEFGHEGVDARPFMLPALAGNVNRVERVLVDELNREIDKALL